MSNRGFIYVLLNPSLFHCVKIGKTTKNPHERAKEITQKSQEALPTPYQVAYKIEVDNCDLLEKLIHQEFKHKRINQDREFFAVNAGEAIQKIDVILKNLERQHKIILFQDSDKKLESWWDNLNFVWKQIFRKHLDLDCKFDETSDFLNTIFNIITYCEDTRMRKKATDFASKIELISNEKALQAFLKWYKPLSLEEKRLFNSYFPYELSEQEVKEVLDLKKIDCSKNIAVVDLAALEKIKNLEVINCSYTNITSLENIKHLLQLKEINLNYTKIEDLKILESFSKLQKIHIENCTRLSNLEIEQFKENNKNCKIAAYEGLLHF